ncbi:hypothetical protein HPB49_012753 [Dermacentor silvarum]|uniref:Uncharacterized protein n=1 Tax=Dermacentor silvarum TaxID=543639 RepID=A0ACB8C9F8_DERSI|nr:hypothetical protein HPB49_012753 [Dermacentor silvarum]
MTSALGQNAPERSLALDTRVMDSVPCTGAGRPIKSSSSASTDGPYTSTGARLRGRPRKTEAVKAETKARYAEAKRRTRRENAGLRAQEAEAKRQRRMWTRNSGQGRSRQCGVYVRKMRTEGPRKRQTNASNDKQTQRLNDADLRAREHEVNRQHRQEQPELRARGAEAMRQRRQEVPGLRAREAEIKRQHRQDNPELRALQVDARRQHRQQHPALSARAADMKRQYREKDPEFGVREAEARRQQRQDHPEIRAREAEAKRLRRRAQAEQRARERLSQHMRRLLYSASGQFAIRGPIVNVPINVNTTVQMLPRDVEGDQALYVHKKRRMIYKSVYIPGMVKKADLLPWLAFLEKSTLYRYYGIQISREKADKVCDNLPGPSDENAERVDCPEEEHNPIEAALAMLLSQQTLVIVDSNVLVMAPGEGMTPVRIVYDEHAEELSFPQTYLGEPRNINPGSKTSVFTMASSECRRTHRRGAVLPRALCGSQSDAYTSCAVGERLL